MRSVRHLNLLLAVVLASTLVSAIVAPRGVVSQERPTFHLPWEAGSVWQINVGNGQGEHATQPNIHGFDAEPVSGRGINLVVAVADGTVIDFQESMPDSAIVNSGHGGNCVIIDHGGSVFSLYAHLAQDSVPLSVGQQITSGTVIGTMGNSGFSTAPHLHWAVLSSAWMYTDTSVSPYRSCSGRTIESRYADNDAELIEDGGLPRAGRLYASSNASSPSVENPPEPTQAPLPTEEAPQSPAPTEAATVAPTEEQTGETAVMDIGAYGPDGHQIGAQFTVTTQDGEFIGSCTLEGDPAEPLPLYCWVSVPRYTTVIVTLDVESITPGLVPLENPVVFDTSGDPGAASSWGVTFQLEPGDPAESGETPPNLVPNDPDDDDPIVEPEDPTVESDDAPNLWANDPNDPNDEDGEGGEHVVIGGPQDPTPSDDESPNIQVREPNDDSSILQPEDPAGGDEGSPNLEANDPVPSDDDDDPPPVVVDPADRSGAVDIALITRDPQNGDLLTGACYVLAGYSNEGCDENGDGQVTFAEIPFGTYTVHQTRTPSGYPTIEDYEIDVAPNGYMEGPSIGVPLGFIVKQAPEQNAPNTRNVSVVFLDMSTKERVTTGACVELVGGSLVGCDQDLVDGQVDFLDVPAGGSYELSFSNLPAGAQVGEVGGPLAISVEAAPGDPANIMVFVLLAIPDDAGSTMIGASDGGSVEEPDTSIDSGSSENMQEPTTSDGFVEVEVLMTFRACHEGFVPDVDDPFSVCTIPLDAPDAAVVGESGDGRSFVSIMDLEREYDGTYIYYGSGDGGYSLEVSGLEPVLRDGFLIYGVDEQDGSRYMAWFGDSDTREIFVFYYYD